MIEAHGVDDTELAEIVLKYQNADFSSVHTI